MAKQKSKYSEWLLEVAEYRLPRHVARSRSYFLCTLLELYPGAHPHASRLRGEIKRGLRVFSNSSILVYLKWKFPEHIKENTSGLECRQLWLRHLAKEAEKEELEGGFYA